MNHDSARQWGGLFEALDAMRPLGPDEIDALYVARPEAPSADIARRLSRPRGGAGHKVVLCGARGSGKSTELSRTARQLHEQFCIVHVDLGAGLPDQAGTLAMLALFGAACVRAVEDWRGSKAPGSTRAVLATALDGLGVASDAVGRLVEDAAPVLALYSPQAGATALALGAASRSVGGLATQAAAVRRELSRDKLAGPVHRDDLEAAQRLVGAVDTALDDLRDLSGRPPLLLADGFDKRTDLRDIQNALADVDLLAGLHADLVITGPVTLRHDPRFRGLPGGFTLVSLPNVGVRSRRSDAPCQEGVELLTELLRRRLSHAGLDTGTVAAPGVELAARTSSGIVREFLELITRAAERAYEAQRDHVSFGDMEAAVRRRRLDLQGYLDEGCIRLLARVLAKGTLPADPGADVLLYENLIACYENGETWFRPHEAIADFVAAHAGSVDG